jgi:hypothetical protein
LAAWRKKAKGYKTEIEISSIDQIRASVGFRQTIQRYSNCANIKNYAALALLEPNEHERRIISLDEHERRIQSLSEAYESF